MKKALIVSGLILSGLLVVVILGWDNLIYRSSLTPEEKNDLIIRKALNDASGEFVNQGEIKYQDFDVYGTSLKIYVEGRVLKVRSAGEDKELNTNDDQIGEIGI